MSKLSYNRSMLDQFSNENTLQFLRDVWSEFVCKRPISSKDFYGPKASRCDMFSIAKLLEHWARRNGNAA